MNRPPLQSTLIKALSGFFQASRTLALADRVALPGLIGLLYIILLVGVARSGTAPRVTVNPQPPSASRTLYLRQYRPPIQPPAMNWALAS
jgi:hypothetical protein